MNPRGLYSILPMDLLCKQRDLWVHFWRPSPNLAVICSHVTWKNCKDTVLYDHDKFLMLTNTDFHYLLSIRLLYITR
jgi:hypothetical protein